MLKFVELMKVLEERKFGRARRDARNKGIFGGFSMSSIARHFRDQVELVEKEIQPSEVYYCDEIMKVFRSGALLLDSADFKDSREAITLLQQISGVINRGIVEKRMQNTPHLVLLNQLFFDREFKPLMAR